MFLGFLNSELISSASPAIFNSDEIIDYQLQGFNFDLLSRDYYESSQCKINGLMQGQEQIQ